ncbi:DUF192 domain-containing protein [Pseudogemmobacter sonorensis]|uniref:DUF192 domain-containing protein n=1 Tax=Pseudogemmobacter sonorensis TaxID=2989681 RepID=UPI003F677F30
MSDRFAGLPGRAAALRGCLAALLVALLAAIPPAAARAETTDTPALAACATDRVDIGWATGRQSFVVEIADTAESRALGLMHRESMPAGAGMLFVYESPRPVAFWMENTLIPLDMVFADAFGRVTRVHAEAVPLDRTPIDGGEGVRFVLEINGGLAAQLGIEPGALLRHPAIGPSALWPC